MEIGIVVLIITGLVEIAKKVLPNTPKYALVSIPLILGVVSGMLFIDADVGVKVFSGLAIGLASMGVFDITKLTRNKV